MTDSEKIKVLAELGEWKRCYENPSLPGQFLGWLNEKWGCVPNYLSSHDAILPLIPKQPDDVLERFRIELTRALMREYGVDWGEIDFVDFLTAAPDLICDSAIKATGKWKD